MPSRRATLAACLFAALGAVAHAEAAYPDRPVTLVVPFSPGGNIDFTARTVADKLGQALGQPVIVDNRAGAGGVIGTAYAARAKADGYTLLLANSGTNAVANAVSKRVAYEGVKSFTVIGGIATVPAVITVSAQVPANTFAEFRKYAQGKAGGASLGTAGNGSFNHLATELVRSRTDTPMTVIPYKGAGPAAADLMGHQIDAMVDQVTTAGPLLREGRVKAIAQLGPKRSHLLPNVPTLAEQGFAAVDATLYTALFAPKGLPAPVARRLTEALQKVMADPVVQKRLADMGADPLPQARQAGFAAYAEAEAQRWAEAAHAAKISIDE